MKSSFSWLKKYVPIDMPAAELAESLTMVGLEVEALMDRYDYLDTVVVGKVIAVEPHPGANTLKRCRVDVGGRQLPVVCGAPNVEPAILAPLALPGTVLADGRRLEKTVIRGEPSEGMLCSEAEIGLGPDGSGVLILPPDLRIGEKLAGALSLSDPVLEIDLTPNRPDCLSIVGIAREVAAIQKTRLTYPEITLPPGEDDIRRYTSVTIEDPEHCPRYAARLLTDITVGPSPFWLQERLLSVGLRPINNIVDVTNFVMMELGQPLHAFDFDRLAENRIVVRTATEGERFTTLDGKERSLAAHMLMICDGEKPVAVGGVMGGLNSEIEPDTRRVLIESACFSPASIRRTAKGLSIGTDASHRFERGVDPEGTVRALNRAAQLMLEVAGGRLIEGVVDAHPVKTPSKPIRLGVSKTNRFLGTALSPRRMAELLASIGFEVRKNDDDTLVVERPSFRVDVERPVDLMEEIARLSGYNGIPTTHPSISAGVKLPSRALDVRDAIRGVMTGFGFSETINYSFMNPASCDRLRLPPDDDRRRLVGILNPLTEDQTVMRTSLLPGLLETVYRNAAQQIRNLKLFEAGKIFIGKGRERLPGEVEMLLGLWTGARFPASWHRKEEACDFFDIKGSVEGLFAKLKVPGVRFTRKAPETCRYMRTGFASDILVSGRSVGLVGEVRGEVLQGFDVKAPVFVFELNVDTLLPLIPDVHQVKPLSKYPATSRDITLIVDRSVESGSVIETVLRLDEKLLEEIHLFGVYEGDPIPTGKKSLSFHVTYRSDQETLQDEAINRLHKDISVRLVEGFKASLPT